LVVTDSTGSNIFIGNDFLSGDIYTEPSSPTNMAASDTVNNVENVYLDASLGLLPPYTVTVKGSHVNVNADPTQTNIIGQDYALVISTDDTTDGLTVTDGGTVPAAPAALVTPVNNGIALLHQRVGANEPNTNQYPGGGLYPAPGYTNGNLEQWHFFTFQNINYLTNQTTNTDTNSIFFNNGTNIAQYYTNAIIATFFPATLTTPDSSPVNLSYPAAQNADIDLYASTDPALFDLDPTALANAHKSLGQGGSETVLFTNIASVSNFYIGVKCETQQGADFDLFAALATNFDNGSLYGNEPITVSAYGLPTVIPDSDDPDGQEGAEVFAFVASPIMTRKVQVTLGVQHENPADLYGTLMHGGEQAVLNHYIGEPGGFTNTYDDLPDGTTSPYPIGPSDGPGTLQNFVGLSGAGQWLLNEKDSVFTQTGMVTMLTLTIWPQPPLIGASGGLDYTNIITLSNNAYYGYVDVPSDATNLEIGVDFEGVGPVGIFLTNQEVPNIGDYGTNITTNGGYLALGTNPPSMGPPLSGGRWYYLITNEDPTLPITLTNFILIQESGTPNLTLTLFNTNATPLLTGAHTDSQICVTNGILSSNQQLASLQVGVCLADTNLDNLVLYLLSPQGTGTELIDCRGGPLATNLGLVASNGFIYLTFTGNAALAPQLVKFFPPPFGQLLTNVEILDSSFEVPAGDYGQSNSLLANIVSTNVDVWTVISNDVAVVASEDLYPAADGQDYLALADGVMTTTIPTAASQAYTMTYDYRGPGLLDWWPFEGDADDIIGTNNGTLVRGSVTYTNFGEVGRAIQFPGTNLSTHGAAISFGTNAGNFGSNDFTIDYWMIMTNNAEEAFLAKRDVCGLGSGWDISIGVILPVQGYVAGFVNLELDDGTANGLVSFSTTMPLNDTNWHHVAFTRRGAVFSAYVDGQFDTNVTVPNVGSLSNAAPLIMGTNVCDGQITGDNGTQAYSGVADELDLWNRALTDVEIAAIYQAGTNHVGKATPVSIFPNYQILVSSGTNTVTNTFIIDPPSSTNWMSNAIYFTALDTNTTITLQGNPLGVLLDDFVVQTPANLNYVQPEEPLSPLIGQNPYGCWTLDVWDTRDDSTASNNGVLYSWNLQMTVSSTNTSLIVLTNGIPYAGDVTSNSIAYFAFDVPAGVVFDTNTLSNCTANLNLLFNQTALPTGNGLGDYTLLTNVTTGSNYVLAADTPPPSLLPGARYFLGVQNTNSAAATFTIEIFTNALTVPATTIELTSGIPYTNTITNAYQYYYFIVPVGATNVSFDITNILHTGNELDLFVNNTLPLPGDTAFDYQASYLGTNVAPIIVTNTSVPAPLTPGTWYLAVYNNSANSTNTYSVEATSYVPAAFAFPAVSVTGMSVSARQFTLTWSAGPGNQYEVDVSSDLIHWTKAADVTTGGGTGSYSDAIIEHSARFYVVSRIQ
jgi:subtilisin-like proprotein convertase family protein